MTGADADVVDPSKNPEVLFTQLKKAPGMHRVAFCLNCVYSRVAFLSIQSRLSFLTND